MLRSFFVSLSKASWAQRTITRWGFARKAAFRFVAGESSAEAIQVVRQLNGRGIRANSRVYQLISINKRANNKSSLIKDSICYYVCGGQSHFFPDTFFRVSWNASALLGLSR